MIRILRDNIDTIPARPKPRGPNKHRIQSIIQDVRQRGDAAVSEYEAKFGGYTGLVPISDEQIQDAYDTIYPDMREALIEMNNRLLTAESAILEALNGAPSPFGMSRTFTPIPSVGCYIPGGQARYPSTAVMSITPASLVGVPRIVAISPNMDPNTIVAADISGATELYSMGGAQGIAALAYGTESISPVSKIVGPGGPVVTTAKRLVRDDTSIDMDAGPTELGIVSDDTADNELISLDLISQAEHGPETFCFLLTTSERQAQQVALIIDQKISDISRADIVKASLYNNGFIMICKDASSMMRLADDIAPEHLQVMTSDPSKDADAIQSPGLLLLGKNTPSAASDYLLGSNHILPTGGQSVIRGQLSVLDFIKTRTVLSTTLGEIANVMSHMRIITSEEGLVNHYAAVRGRIP